MEQPNLRDLALLGDRRTAALVDRQGTICWYCPGRFDRPSLLASLLDAERGGSWTVALPGAVFDRRGYVGDSGVLETWFHAGPGDDGTDGQGWCVTDWMPMGETSPAGLCRQFEAPPTAATVRLRPAPDYGRRPARLRQRDGAVVIDDAFLVFGSHPLTAADDVVTMALPGGEQGWMFVADGLTAAPPTADDVARWRRATLDVWSEIASHATYHGPYEQQVAASVRLLRLLTYAPNGGVIAAPTTSLPEVLGGERNYDYRYVWLRDAGMIASALTRVGSDGNEERRFLAFICAAERDVDGLPLAPFYTLDGTPAPEEVAIDLAGYHGSRPVRIGNGARAQIQFGAYGNVLLAAKLIYGRFDTREHWPVVACLADYLAAHWQEPDYGIWEEREPHQYTASKVITAVALSFIADHSEDAAQAERWRAAADEIRAFVAANCINAAGAYAAVAGGEQVDVSAALFPVWAYTDADTPEMEATMRALERDCRAGALYRRYLVCDDSAKEGGFLAGTLWVAQYWVMRDPDRARGMIDDVLQYSNDLGFFSEEADPRSGRLLGNFPQTFVHAALIGAVHDLKTVLEEAER